MSDVEDQNEKNRIKRMKAVANQALTESGERDRLVQLLQTRLLECGWNDKVVVLCKDVVRDVGVDNITLDTLINEVTPKARQLVDDSIKRELLQKIKTSLQNQSSHNLNSN